MKGFNWTGFVFDAAIAFAAAVIALGSEGTRNSKWLLSAGKGKRRREVAVALAVGRQAEMRCTTASALDQRSGRADSWSREASKPASDADKASSEEKE